MLIWYRVTCLLDDDSSGRGSVAVLDADDPRRQVVAKDVLHRLRHWRRPFARANNVHVPIPAEVIAPVVDLQQRIVTAYPGVDCRDWIDRRQRGFQHS